MVKCCVHGCIPTSEKDVTYFRFPTLRILRRKWEKAIGAQSKPKLNSMVCSQHFLTTEYESTRGRMRLKSGAIPSIFDLIKKKHKDSSNKTPPPDENSQDSTKSNSKTEEVPNKENDKNDKNNDKLDATNDDNDKSDTKNGNNEEETKENDESDKVVNENEDNDKCNKNSGNEEKERYLKNVSLVKKDNSVDNSKDSDTGVKELQNGEERVQEGVDKKPLGDEEKNDEEKDKQSCKKEVTQDKCIESAPKLPDGPRDIDKEEEDIEALLTNYHIKQNKDRNIHSVTEQEIEPAPETIEIEIEPEKDPVFIEIPVDKDNSNADKSDCLMVLESLEVELDPSELMLPERDIEPELELETVEIDDNPEPKDPISLLTSSDEDEVIIEEPHIDTVEVSDETDEDDMPLVKLFKRRRSEKVKKPSPVNKDDNADIAKILWGMYEYYCVQCHFTTSSGIEYRKHTATHAKVLMMCQICGYMTASEQQFTKHEKQHGDKKYKCHLCPYKAKHNMSLLYHLKGHKAEDFISSASVSNVNKVSVNKYKFECNLCDYSTKKRCDLNRHVARRHKEELDEDYVP